VPDDQLPVTLPDMRGDGIAMPPGTTPAAGDVSLRRTTHRLLARRIGSSQFGSSRAITLDSSRNALPRWLIASFSGGLSSAFVRVWPSPRKIGS